ISGPSLTKSKAGPTTLLKRRLISMTEKCIVCGCSEVLPFYRGVVRCRRCGHVYANLQLSAEELSTLYQKEYFFGDEYNDYIADKAVLQKNFALRMKTLQDYIRPIRHRHLFE